MAAGEWYPGLRCETWGTRMYLRYRSSWNNSLSLRDQGFGNFPSPAGWLMLLHHRPATCPSQKRRYLIEIRS